MSKNDGGPAFPIQIVDHISNDNKPGMSLRDWFAGQAFVALIRMRADTDDVLAQRAYKYADAALKAREQ